MKTPSSNKTRKVNTKPEIKPKPKIIKDFHPVTYLIKNIPKPVYVIIALFISFYLYHIFIQPEFDKYIAIDYLKAKYNKDFNVRQDHSAPNWIGKPPTYHGLAKVKDGSDDVEFEVICGIDDRRCSDFYLERSWARSEENKIRQYLGSELFKNSKVKVNIIARVDRYDLKTPVSNLDYYLKNNNSHLFEYYLISFDTKTKNITEEDVEHGKLVVKKLISYINERKLGENGRFKDYLSVSHTIISDGDEIAKCGIDLNKESDIKEDCFKKERKGLYFK